MTDYRATDLGYGHPGKATYDPEENQWGFSINLDEEQHVQQISAFEECLPPSFKTHTPSTGKPSDLPKNHLKRFVKQCPELFAANDLLSGLVKYEPKIEADITTHSGTLLATGCFYVRKRRSKLIALPCGEAGHILRIIRIQTRSRGWGGRRGRGGRHGPSIQHQYLHSTDQGYWMGAGGTIRQILFSEDENDSASWLAVRQDSVTTIFRPSYGESQMALVQGSTMRAFRASPLQANPVVSLSINKTGSQSHAHVSFNPWYTRQFIMVDLLGNWSIWDIESHLKGIRLVAGRSGNVFDGYEPDPLSKTHPADHEDGWHYVCWISDLATIVVCNRQTIAIFCVKAEPIRLRSIDLSKSFSGRIIDVKRSVADQSHLLVLTTSQIFWIEVIPAGEGYQDQTGARILLSYRHFRNANDETLRLAPLQDEYVVVTSSQTPLLNIYAFKIKAETREPISWQSSFVLSTNLNSQSLDTLCFVPAPFDAGHDANLQSVEERVQFFQVWALTSELALSSTICVAHSAISKDAAFSSFWKTSQLNHPRSTFYSKISSDTVVREPFIIKDHEDEDHLEILDPSSISHISNNTLAMMKQHDPRFKLDWRSIFDHIYRNDKSSKVSSLTRSEHESGTLETLLRTLWDEFHRSKQTGGITKSTLFELVGQITFPEELDRATNALHGFIQEFKEINDPEDDFKLAVSNLTRCPSMDSLTTANGESDLSSFLEIYDRLTDGWMSSLPEDVSNFTRLSKYKTIRRVAIELGLSSIGVSLTAQDPTSLTQLEIQDFEEERLVSPEMTPEPSQTASQSLPSNRNFRTPSVYSRTTTAISEAPEDPAITRLRKYAISIDNQPDHGKSRLLSHWVVGGNPTEYSWETASNNAAAAESGDDKNRKKRREDARRKRMTEKFLSRERSKVTAIESQPVSVPRGSQPDVGHNMFSSQPVVEVPMTQPDRGAFGSRSVAKGKKKKPKVRNAGF